MNRGTARDVAGVIAAAGEVVGRTRLQKMVAILEIAGVGYGFPYDYYKFGPYSEELVESADRAVALGYVFEEERRAAWGGRYSIFRSSAPTSTGVPARDALISLAKGADAVALELAVTAAFLADTGSNDPWQEVERRKPEKVTSLRKAKDLYKEFRKIPDLPRPLPAIV